MSGEQDLNRMLASLSPTLMDEAFVFLSFSRAQYGDFGDLDPIAAFRESEGLTLVVPESVARERGFDYDAVFRGITLGVHSSLEAVGLTAAVSRALAERGISANVVAAYYHDHIFVQDERAEEAMSVLESLRG